MGISLYVLPGGWLLSPVGLLKQNITDWVAYTNISISRFRRLESPSSVTSMFTYGERPPSWFVAGAFLLCPYLAEGAKDSFGVSL